MTLQGALQEASLNTYPADAIRDYKFITELNGLPPAYQEEKRIHLFGFFTKLDTREPGTRNYPYDIMYHPYDTTYRTLQREIIQNRDGVRDLLRKSLPRLLSWTDHEREMRPDAYQEGKAPDIYSPFLDSLARFIIGTLGGCALIVPMLLMTLNPSLTKSLIVVSVSVVLFALVIGFVFDADNKDMITASATYAAVLVVFVGTSGGGNGSGA
jgi:hypothetical protein